MKITTNYSGLLEELHPADDALERHIQDSFDGAVDDALADAKARAPRRTGRYAASLRRTGSGLDAAIVSDVPYAATLESMRGDGKLDEAGKTFLRAMTRRLKERATW